MGTIKCTVSGGKPGGKKEKRETEAEAMAQVDNGATLVENLSGKKKHVHKARAHPRGLRDMVGALKV